MLGQIALEDFCQGLILVVKTNLIPKLGRPVDENIKSGEEKDRWRENKEYIYMYLSTVGHVPQGNLS